MSDLGPSAAATLTCPRCGAQNERPSPERRGAEGSPERPGAEGAARCRICGTVLDAEVADAERGDLELEEVWRAAGVAGWDSDVELRDGRGRCPRCQADLHGGALALDARTTVRDTPTGRTEVVVALFRCPTCGTPSRTAARPADLARPTEPGGASRTGPGGEGGGPPPERPLGSDRRFFEPGREGTLADQRDLLDAEGEDIRQYTGEPVETEEGWVIPQQQNVGPGNEAGQGEWPDPETPSVMSKEDQPDP